MVGDVVEKTRQSHIVRELVGWRCSVDENGAGDVDGEIIIIPGTYCTEYIAHYKQK